MKLAKTNVAIIPARAGSKRLPNKNIKIFNGRPLFQWSVEAAINSGLFDKIILSSDCSDILTSEQASEKVVKVSRPNELATDQASQEDVIIHALEVHEIENSNVCLLQPTSPLRTAADIKNSFELLKEKRCCIISAAKICQKPTKWILPKNNEDKCSDFLDKIEDCFMPNGAIYWFPNVDGNLNLSRCPSAVFEMEARFSVDIDTAFEFALAEFVYRY